MKHSLWRLISSFYILLISGLMVIISAYAWMVISKSPDVSGTSTGVNVPKLFYDTITISKEELESFPLTAIESTVHADGTVEFKIDSAEDFVVVMRAIENGKLSGKITLSLGVQISMEDTFVWDADEWDGITIDSSDQIEKVTICANTAALGMSTAYIFKLSDSLFQSINATSVEFQNVTILEAEIKSNGNIGAFVSSANQANVSFESCHVIDSNISGMDSSVGAMIGYANLTGAQIKNSTVENTSLQGATVGKMIGTIYDGSTVIANNGIPDNGLYGALLFGETGKLNLVNTEFAMVDVYGGFVQAAADCFGSDLATQTWFVYGSLKMADEIRFRGNHVDIVGKENAVIELSDRAGFNFADYGENKVGQQFQASSSVKLTNITFHNRKENTNDYSYYMYVNARNVVYSACSFDRGVAVFGSAYFSNCTITDDLNYCVNFVGGASDSICSISNSQISAGANALGCVLADGQKQLFAIFDSDFYNRSAYPSVYVTGNMQLLTDGKNYFDSPSGGILTENEGSCSFNSPDFFCLIFDQYRNADIVTKAQMDRTEPGNNAAVQVPDSDIDYDIPVSGQIPSEITPDSVDSDTDTSIYFIDSAEKFIAVMRMLNQKDANGASMLSGNYRIILQTNIDLTPYLTDGVIWESVNINDKNQTLKTITIETDTEALKNSTAFIKGFNAPWFGWMASDSNDPKIVFKDITTVGSVMNLNAEEHSFGGVFISNTKISVDIQNCHVLNSEISGTPNADGKYSSLGGFIGYADATEIRIQNSSVRGSSLKGASVGGIVGQTSASKNKDAFIVDCFVDHTVMIGLEENTSWRVGELVGTAGTITVVNPLILENTLIQETASDKQKNEETQGNDPNYFLYGNLPFDGSGKMIFVDNRSEIHTAVVYGGLNINSASFLTSDKQLWLVYDVAYLDHEIRFTGSDITVKSYGESATLVLNSNVTDNSFGKGQLLSASGFNFGEVGQYTDSFKEGSAIRFMNLTIKNRKTYETAEMERKNDRSYAYAFAENVYFQNCVFEDGVVVYGNAEFDRCAFETFRENDLCLLLDNKGYDCMIQRCRFTAKENAKGCVVSEGTRILTVNGSSFVNQTGSLDILLNGKTTVYFN